LIVAGLFLYFCGMGVRATFNVFREHAIDMIWERTDNLMQSATNQELGDVLDYNTDWDTENYTVVDYEEKDDPDPPNRWRSDWRHLTY
jgi:hypothetical protein